MIVASEPRHSQQAQGGVPVVLSWFINPSSSDFPDSQSAKDSLVIEVWFMGLLFNFRGVFGGSNYEIMISFIIDMLYISVWTLNPTVQLLNSTNLAISHLTTHHLPPIRTSGSRCHLHPTAGPTSWRWTTPGCQRSQRRADMAPQNSTAGGGLGLGVVFSAGTWINRWERQRLSSSTSFQLRSVLNTRWFSFLRDVEGEKCDHVPSEFHSRVVVPFPIVFINPLQLPAFTQQWLEP